MAVATTLVIASMPRLDLAMRCMPSRQGESGEPRSAGDLAERSGVRVVVAGATLEVVTTGRDDPALPQRTVETRTVVRQAAGRARPPCVETLIACHFEPLVPEGMRALARASSRGE